MIAAAGERPGQIGAIAVAECIDQARAEGHDVIYTDAQGNRTDADGNPAPEPGQDPADLHLDDPAWVNFDFVPGDRVLLYDDFAADRVGNFPRRLEFGAGNMEVAEWRDHRFLRITSPGFFRVPQRRIEPGAQRAPRRGRPRLPGAELRHRRRSPGGGRPRPVGAHRQQRHAGRPTE